MSKKSMTTKAEAEKAVKDIRRATRKIHNAEEKIRIVLAGLGGDHFEGKDQVPLMTIHKSKGLEFHTMIFFGLDAKTWWSLSPERGEELNSFFVAFTRAKQRAFFAYCSERGNAIDWLEQLLLPAGVEQIDGANIVTADR